MTNKEIYEIFEHCESKKDLINKLNINTQHKSGSYINNLLNSIAKSIGFDKSLSSIEIKKRYIEKQKEEYYKNPRYCIICGNIIKFSKRNNKFCSQSCAATYTNKKRGSKTVEEKQKISESVKLFYKSKPTNNKLIKTCKECGKTFIAKYTNKGKISVSKFCSCECSHNYRSRYFKEKQNSLIKAGKHKGWNSRNITSYAEKFWIKVLENNNITYQKEFHFNKKYFLDFYIEINNIKIDLEIDGKQHKYKERQLHDIERDKYLQENGVIVYRIEWNEIKTKNGSIKMKEKIKNFINFYNQMGH